MIFDKKLRANNGKAKGNLFLNTTSSNNKCTSSSFYITFVNVSTYSTNSVSLTERRLQHNQTCSVNQAQELHFVQDGVFVEN